MGRDVPRPAGYAPWLEFYLRVAKEGGDVRRPPIFHERNNASLRNACTILVHGFNNTEGEAAIAYYAFRGRQVQIFGLSDPSTLEQRFGDAFWPGDANWWWLFDKVDFLVYPFAVHKAPTAGAAIAELIGQMPNLERVDFVGHSLGCRVVLETIDIIRQRAGPLVGHVCLMAAAVPLEMVETGGQFWDTLAQICDEGAKVLVLYSSDDLVLHWAFPPGQAAAGEPSIRALGRYGPSPDTFGFQAQVAGSPVNGAGHSDYWGQTGSDPSGDATKQAGLFLEIGPSPREIGTSRANGSDAQPPQARELGTTRAI